MRLSIFFLLFLLPLFVFAEDPVADLPFPLLPALETGRSGNFAWRPDWPEDIPPDAFSVKGDAVFIRLAGTSTEYRLRRDGQGRLVEFPFVLEGEFLPVRVEYAPSGGIAGLVFGEAVVGEDETEPWTVEFPLPYTPFESPAPRLPEEAARVSRGETVYFVLFGEGGQYIAESWYDPAGNLIAYFRVAFGEREGERRLLSVQGSSGAEYYSFDNGDHVTEASGPRGVFSAVYGARGFLLERTWTLAPVNPPPADPDAAPAPAPAQGRFSLQWDELGFLVSMRSSGPDSPEHPFEYRYEYTLDQRGNWLIRRETAYVRRGDLLVPVSSRQIERQIVYAAGSSNP